MDCHTHCWHSHDTNEDPRKMINRAVELGMKYIALTDHSDRDYSHMLPIYGEMQQLDMAKHIEEIMQLKREYSDRIYVALGIECSYHPLEIANYKRDMSITDEWDIILNSVHTVKGHDLYYPSYFGDKPKHDRYREYLLAVYDSINIDMSYDVIGHLGYVARKAIYDDNSLKYCDHADILECIMKAIINRGVSLEINTNAKNIGADFLPFCDIADRYVELGGREFTFGSDAHWAEIIGSKIDIVRDYLASHNIKTVNIYKKRKIERVLL